MNTLDTKSNTTRPMRIRRNGWGSLSALVFSLLLWLPKTAEAAPTLTTNNPSVTLTAADFGMSGAQAHGRFTGTSTWSGGNISGTALSLTDGIVTITKSNLVMWTYSGAAKNLSISASYTVTNPTLVITGVPSSTSSVTITSVLDNGVTYSNSTKNYTGYANMILDLSKAKRSGNYSTTGTTITVTLTII